MLARTLICLVAAGAPVLAQGVTVAVHNATPLRLRANAMTKTLAAGTDLTQGLLLSVADSSTPMASASVALGVQHLPASSTVRLTDSGSAGFDLFSQGSASLGPQRIEVDYRSPRPMKAQLTVRHCTSATNTLATYSGTVQIGSQATVNSTKSLFCFPGQYSDSQTFNVVVDPAGLTVSIDTSGGAVGAWRGGNGSFFGNWEVELVPDPNEPCVALPYGNACGAQLTVTSDLRYPAQHVVTLQDNSLPSMAALAFGTQRVAVPIAGGCTLYNNALVLLPWAIDANGTAVTYLDPPPVPGLTFKIQAATLGGITFHATLGYDLSCR